MINEYFKVLSQLGNKLFDELQTHRINNKPIRVGFKIGVFAEAYDCVVQFEPYQGVQKGKQVAYSIKWGLGENILRLMEYLSPTVIIGLWITTSHISIC